MMKRNPSAVFWFGLLLFLIVFGLSVLLQSPVLLYIASAIPMIVMPFLPDVRTNQSLKPGASDVEIVMLDGGGDPAAEMLIVTFTPGRIYWNRRYVFIPLDQLNTVPAVRSSEYTAAITVLRHDLKFDTKRNRIGVYVPHLLERLKGMPYTKSEVNRLVLRMEDVRDTIIPASIQSSLSRKMDMNA